MLKVGYNSTHIFLETEHRILCSEPGLYDKATDALPMQTWTIRGHTASSYQAVWLENAWTLINKHWQLLLRAFAVDHRYTVCDALYRHAGLHAHTHSNPISHFNQIISGQSKDGKGRQRSMQRTALDKRVLKGLALFGKICAELWKNSSPKASQTKVHPIPLLFASACL